MANRYLLPSLSINLAFRRLVGSLSHLFKIFFNDTHPLRTMFPELHRLPLARLTRGSKAVNGSLSNNGFRIVWFRMHVGVGTLCLIILLVPVMIRLLSIVLICFSSLDLFSSSPFGHSLLDLFLCSVFPLEVMSSHLGLYGLWHFVLCNWSAPLLI